MMVEALARLQAAVADCADAPTWSLSDDEVLASLDQLHSAGQRLAAAQAHLIREVDRRGLPATAHATSTTAWLRERLRISGHAAKRLTGLARDLDLRPGLDTAICAGAVNAEQATVIAAAVHAVPMEVGAETVAKAETTLIGFAAEFDPVVLRRLGERILHHVAPDVADEWEGRALLRAQTRAFGRRTLALTSVGDGQVRLTGWLDDEAAATVTAALDPLCAPVTGDERTAGQRRADALTDVCRLALNTGELPVNGGERPQLIVTVPYDQIAGRLGAGGLSAGDLGAGDLGAGLLDTGQRLTPAQVRRLACDAQLMPAVLGGDGQVLDLGQTRRLFTGAVRRALVLRDGGCAFPGCDRPPRWCDAHHITHWSAGGPTNVDNGVLVCGFHHRLLHHSDWSVRLGNDRRPEFIPPAHVDPHRRPRRNPHHHGPSYHPRR